MESHARVVHRTRKHQIVADDPDDGAVIGCAVEAGAHVIVSGDRHRCGNTGDVHPDVAVDYSAVAREADQQRL